MIMLDETEVATIDDPELSTIQESGQHNSFVDIKLIFVSFYSFFLFQTQRCLPWPVDLLSISISILAFR